MGTRLQIILYISEFQALLEKLSGRKWHKLTPFWWVLLPRRCKLFGETHCLHPQGWLLTSALNMWTVSLSETLPSTHESTRHQNPSEQHHDNGPWEPRVSTCYVYWMFTVEKTADVVFHVCDCDCYNIRTAVTLHFALKRYVWKTKNNFIFSNKLLTIQLIITTSVFKSWGSHFLSRS
jgi:hypothetical protein